jgi:ribose transport system permease protein
MASYTHVEAKKGSALPRMVTDNFLLITIWGVLILMITAASIASPTFRSPENLITLLKQAVVPGILGAAQTILILSGAIDLSMGSAVTLISLVTAGIMNSREELILPVAFLGILIGTGIGLIHGILTTKARLEPFIVTLGTFSILQGIAYAYTTVPIGGIATPMSTALYYGQLGPIPYSIFYFIVIFILAYLLLTRTSFGRKLYAIGGNPEVARRSGINVDRIKLIRFTLAGFLVSIAALILTARMGIGDPLAGQGMELDTITASVIGGVSLFGGRGSLLGTLAGILILGVINNFMVMLDVSMFYQQLIKGAIVLIAVAIYKQRL